MVPKSKILMSAAIRRRASKRMSWMPPSETKSRRSSKSRHAFWKVGGVARLSCVVGRDAVEAAWVLQLAQRLRFDLADAFAGLLADLFERVVGVHADAEGHANMRSSRGVNDASTRVVCAVTPPRRMSVIRHLVTVALATVAPPARCRPCCAVSPFVLFQTARFFGSEPRGRPAGRHRPSRGGRL